MQTSQVTTKGQVTIPAKVRHQLGIHQGDRVGFICEDGKIVILPVIQDIEAAFGLVSSERSASLDDMEKTIQDRGNKL
jgi:AbrB family looped-hinge helix DNA binding protein